MEHTGANRKSPYDAPMEVRNKRLSRPIFAIQDASQDTKEDSFPHNGENRVPISCWMKRDRGTGRGRGERERGERDKDREGERERGREFLKYSMHRLS